MKRSHRVGISILSPHPGLLAELQHLLSGPRFKVSAARVKFGPGLELRSSRMPRASVFIVDAISPGPATVALIERIRERAPRSRVIVVKETLEDGKVFPYLRVGVRGVVRYVDARRDLARASKAVAGGGFWLARPQLARFLDSLLRGIRSRLGIHEPGQLSRREREVLLAILQGLSNKEIAGQLNISERTVKFHVSNLLQKFGAQRRADLILKHYQTWPMATG